MNKQSNVYTIIYIIVLVVVVGAALAFTAMSLKDRQTDNVNADKMRQILSSVHIVPQEQSLTVEVYNSHITSTFVVNARGERVDGDAFSIDMASECKVPAESRRLPVYVCTTDDGATKYILPIYGQGLWGPIWGYVALNDNGSTIYGAYFAHESETPGLGAEIEKSAFSDKFVGKNMWKDGRYMLVTVVKAGQKPAGDEDYVDGVSGGTVTSKGVAAMLGACLAPYESFLKTLRAE